MAGLFLLGIEFTAANTVDVQHNADGVVEIVLNIDGVVRQDLISKIVTDANDPTNKCVVFLKSAQTGVVKVFEPEGRVSVQPSPEQAAGVQNSTPPSPTNPYATQQDINDHADLTNNPHGTTAAQIGAADLVHTQPASTITDFDTSVAANSAVTDNTNHRNATGNPHSATPADIGAAPTVHTQAASTITDFDTAVEANADVVASLAHANIASGNPHGTNFSSLLGGTLAQLNSLISNANVDDAGDPRDPNPHTQAASTITDFDAEVSNNSDVSNNTNHRGLSNNPHSTTATQVGAIPTAEKGAANGVATLDGTGKVPSSQIPVVGTTTYVVANSTERLALTGLVTGDLAIQTDDGSQWVWNGSGWDQLPAATGDVSGPASSTDNELVRFDGATGKQIQGSVASLSDAGLLTTKLLKVEPVTPGTINHVSFEVNQDATDPYNLNLDNDPGRVIATTQDGSFRNCFVFSADSDGTKTAMGVSSSSNGGSTWTPRFVVLHDGRIGINKNDPFEALDIVGNIVLTGTVDGRDVAADGTTQDNHIASAANPHNTSLANLVVGTLAQLNALLSDANVDDANDPRDPNPHTQAASTITDFDTEVANNVDVAANTTHRGTTGNPHSADTDDIPEGSTNEYYSEAKVSANSDVSANTTHRGRTDNPHNTTKTQIGLGNVTNDAQLTRGANDWTGFPENLSPDSNAKILTESGASGAKEYVQLANLIPGFSEVGASAYNPGGFALPDNPTWGDVPLTSAFESVEFSINADSITVNEAGTYFVFAHVAITQVSGNSRDTAQMRVTRNGTEIPGTIGGLYSRNISDGQTTAAVGQFIPLGAGDIIRLQVREATGSGEIETLSASLVLFAPIGPQGPQGPQGVPGSGSTIVVEDEGSVQGTVDTINFEGNEVQASVSGGTATVTVSAPTPVFGQDYQRVEANNEIQTSSTSLNLVALTLNVPSGLNGTYRLGWGALVGNSDTVNNAAVRLYNSTDGVGISEEYVYESQDAANRVFQGSVNEITLSGSAKTIEIRYRSQDGAGTTIVGRRYIEFWRVA
jgi:hypothetical protein